MGNEAQNRHHKEHGGVIQGTVNQDRPLFKSHLKQSALNLFVVRERNTLYEYHVIYFPFYEVYVT